MAKIMLFFGMLAAAVAANAASVFVKIGASGAADGTSWANAYTDIGAALAAAEAGDTLYVAGGTYSVTASLPYKAVAIYGGFAGDEAAPNPAARQLTPGGKPWEFVNPTVIDASGWVEVGANSYTMFAKTDDNTPPTALTLDGLTLQNRAPADDKILKGEQTVLRATAGLTMRSCVVKVNKGMHSDKTTGTGQSYAIKIRSKYDGEVVIQGCKFTENTGWDGGTIYIDMSGTPNVPVRISGCLFTDNHACTAPAIFSEDGQMLIENSIFSESSSLFQGGAVRIGGGATTIVNSIFRNNKSAEKDGTYGNGAAIYRTGGSLAVISCVFDGNGSSKASPATIDGGDVVVHNSIFTNSKGSHLSGGNQKVTYCMFDKAVPAGEGNIAYSEGVFTNAAAGDYTLAENSPAKGAGTFTIPNSKTSWGQTDMGAYGGEWTESPYFHVVFERRYGGLLKDNGAAGSVTAQKVYPSAVSLFTDSLQWRFIREGSYFRVQSKLGNYLDMKGVDLTTQSADGATAIFKFDISAVQPCVQLRGNYPGFGSVVNKPASGNGVAGKTDAGSSDAGSAITLVPVENMPKAMPKLNAWYQIYALDGATSIGEKTKVWQGNGQGNNITSVRPNAAVLTQFWRFVAADSGVKIQNWDETYFKSKNSDNDVPSITDVAGDVFALTWNEYSKNATKGGAASLQQRWSLYNASVGKGDYSYVCAANTNYWDNSMDRELEFVAVEPSLTLSADTVHFGNLSGVSDVTVKTVSVDVRFVTGEVSCTIEGAAAAPFAVAKADGWSESKGGTLSLSFDPAGLENGVYTATLVVKAASESVEVSDTLLLAASVTSQVTLTVIRDTGMITLTSPAGNAPSYVLGAGTMSVEFSTADRLAAVTSGVDNPQPLPYDSLGGGRYRITLADLQSDTTITIEAFRQDAKGNPLVISGGESEQWYYIKLEKRDWGGAGQQYLYDQGAGEPLIVAPCTNLDRKGAQWKLAAGENVGEYKLVSKRGNEVAYNPAGAALTGDSASVGADRFFAAPASQATYRLIADDAHPELYQLNLASNAAISINKHSATNQLDGNRGDGDGTAISFIPQGSSVAPTGTENRLPVITTTDKDEFYYNISFARRTDDKVITDKGAGNNLVQEPVAEKNMAQAWKLRPVSEPLTKILSGDGSDAFKVESFDGNRLASSSAKTSVVGDEYSFYSSAAAEYGGWWLLKRASGDFINSYGGTGTGATAVGEYPPQGDGGSVLKFTYVPTAAYIVADSAQLTFGDVLAGTARVLTLTVAVRNPTDDDTVTCEVSGANASSFTLAKADEWNPRTGGTLSVAFAPEAAQPYSATLRISNAASSVELPLAGSGVSALLSLNSLTVSSGAMEPAFAPDVFAYTVRVGNNLERITLAATSASPDVSVAGDGEKSLSVGENVFTITIVDNSSGAEHAYTVTVIRSRSAALAGITVSNADLPALELSPAFSPDVREYSLTVDKNITYVIVLARPVDEDALVDGNGTMQLEEGSNVAEIVVTSADSLTTLTYAITINRGEPAEPQQPSAVTATAAATLTIYPNPATHGVLIVEHGDQKSGEAVEVYTLAGTLAATCKASPGEKTTLNVSSLPKGAYIVKLGARTAKVMVGK